MTASEMLIRSAAVCFCSAIGFGAVLIVAALCRIAGELQ